MRSFCHCVAGRGQRSERKSQVRLDKSRAGVDVDLAQERVSGVNESVRYVRRNDDDATRFHLTLFVSYRDGGATFESECDFDVGMLM